MKPSQLLFSVFGPQLVGAYLVTPPGVAAPGAPADCSGWVLGSTGSTCANIETSYGLTEAQFEAWNPTTTELALGCTLVASFYYCIQIDYASSLSSSTTPTSSLASTATSITTTSDGVSTPTPYQTGMSTICNNFHLVNSGDECDTIATEYGIILTQFYAWNPAVGTTCGYLDIGDYVCVGVIGNTPTTTTVVTTTLPTSTGDGVSTPTPYQTGMTTNCNSFHLVVSGDQCGAIASEYGISLTQFYAWNPAVGTTCSYLALGDYVCVDIIGYAPTTTLITKTTTSATATGGISTPTPYQTGMATNCINFHLVVSGDQCGAISTEYGISLTQFYSWNPAVGSNCKYLALGDYVCVEIEDCTSASILAAAPAQAGLTCGAPGLSHDGSTSLLIESYTAGSPYVESAAACGAQCLATSSCTNLYFIEGSYCNLHQGASTFALSTASGYYLWYEASCFSSGSCGVPGVSHDTTSLLIESYTAGSPYVESAAACGAQCLATPACTNLYFIEGNYCNLHQGTSTFAASTASGYYLWYEATCFSSGEACGSYGFSNDTISTLLVSYTSGSPYVASAAACGAQCLATSGCTNVYFMEDDYCNLHFESSFSASTASGYYSWYQAGCFACNSLN